MALLILLILCLLFSYNIKPASHLFQNTFLKPLNLESWRALDWIIHALHLEGHWRIHYNTSAFFRDVLNYLDPQKGLTRRKISMFHKDVRVSFMYRTDTWHHFSPQHNFRIRHIGSLFLEWKSFLLTLETHLSSQSMGVLPLTSVEAIK